MSLIDDLFKDVPLVTGKYYPFKIQGLIAAPGVTPRQTRLEFYLEIGRPFIHAVIDQTSLEGYGPAIVLILPERWLSVHEQRSLLHLAAQHAEIERVEVIRVYTQNPLVVGSLGDGVCLEVYAGPEPGYVEGDRRGCRKQK
jgi:hypothetical protein